MALKMISNIMVIGAVLSGALFIGCVHQKSTAKPNSLLAAQYIVKGKNLENKGFLSEAHEQYKLAQTVGPKNGLAELQVKKSTRKLAQLADKHFELAKKYRRKKKFGLARKELLMSLKYQPTHTKAYNMLIRERPFTPRDHVVHTVQKGETLAIIATIYYGDYKKYKVIEKYNNIKNARQVSPGQTIKIPDVARINSTESETEKSKIISGYVWHTIIAGQSVSKLARLYYGDKNKYYLITEYNGIKDPARVKVGHRIKIPKVEGLPFKTVEQKKPKPTVAKATEPPAKKSGPTSTAATTVEPPKPELKPELKPDLKPELKEELKEEPQAFNSRDIGIALYKEGKFEDAVFELNRAIAETPNDDRTRTYLHKAYFELGNALLEQRDFQASGEAFERSLLYHPQCAKCEENIEKTKTGQAFTFRRNGVDHLDRKDYQSAIEQFEKYLQIKSDDVEVRHLLSETYYQKALAEYGKGNFVSAMAEFKTALEYNGQCEKCSDYLNKSTNSLKETHYNRGVAYFAKEHLQKAIDEWEKVYKLDPGYKNVEQNLNRARTLQKKLKKIIERQQN